MACIYALHHPLTGELRYIGKANDADKRLKSHLRDAKRLSRPVAAWVRSLVNDGLLPEMWVIRETDDWEAAEVEEIASARKRGARLLNLADGGATNIPSAKESAGKRCKAMWQILKRFGDDVRFYKQMGWEHDHLLDCQKWLRSLKGEQREWFVAQWSAWRPAVG